VGCDRIVGLGPELNGEWKCEGHFVDAHAYLTGEVEKAEWRRRYRRGDMWVCEFGVEGGEAAIGAENAGDVGWCLAHGGDDRAPGDELRFCVNDRRSRATGR
jgi:hypothetical protein